MSSPTFSQRSLSLVNWTDERFLDPVLLGTGAYGYVYKCTDTQTNSVVAVKILKFNREEGGVPGQILREVAALQELNHHNIVSVGDVKWEDEAVKIAMECVDTDISKYMREVRPEPSEIKSFMSQILQGLSHCHSRGIVHRDLKPDNILLYLDTKTIKIADFSNITRLADGFHMETKPTTIQYNPPEILLGLLADTPAVDIWSAGCTFAEMIRGIRLFPGIADYVVLTKIISYIGVPSEQQWPGIKYSCLHLLGGDQTEPLPARIGEVEDLFGDVELEPSALDLLIKMLRFDPNDRISAEDALQHPYFNQPEEVPDEAPDDMEF